MDKLKDFIDNNRQDFDNIELPGGHAERFRQKLEKQQKRPARNRLMWFVAAAAILGLLVTFHVQLQKEEHNEVCELSSEISELRMYYNMQITSVVAQMEELYKQKQSQGALELLKQTQEVMASNQDFENNILPSLPCSESALFAMNQHYDTSIAGMNILLRQMRKVADDKENNH